MSAAVVFPGQGSQSVGMGAEVLERSLGAKALWDGLDETLGRPLTRIIVSGPTNELNDTINAQPALFVVNMLYWIALREAQGRPEFVAGHSLGELSASAAAGVFSFEEGLQIVSRRAALMSEAAAKHPGGMIAVLGLPVPPVVEICRSAGVEIANFNAPGQVVVAGHRERLDAAEGLLREAGAKRVVRLAVSGPFHTSEMAEAAHDFGEFLEQIEFQDPQIPLISNVTAQPATTGLEVKKNLVRQINSPVRWVESVEYLVERGVTRFIEAGPGRVLTGLIKRIAPSISLTKVEELLA